MYKRNCGKKFNSLSIWKSIWDVNKSLAYHMFKITFRRFCVAPLRHPPDTIAIPALKNGGNSGNLSDAFKKKRVLSTFVHFYFYFFWVISTNDLFFCFWADRMIEVTERIHAVKSWLGNVHICMMLCILCSERPKPKFSAETGTETVSVRFEFF